MSEPRKNFGALRRWQELQSAGTLGEDAHQRRAAARLQLLHEQLSGYGSGRNSPASRGFLGFGHKREPPAPVKGFYLHGGVGRGKSMLMDFFFEDAPVVRKRRVHFHAFMQEIHAGITAARRRGDRDPIAGTADGVAEQARLLCFDELQITDITDAMIVGRLFERLFAKGVVVITTSNRRPGELYKDGLNRDLFLPFIDLIEDRMEVWELDGDRDHRLTRLSGVPVWYSPTGIEAEAAMDAAWEMLAGGAPEPLDLRVGSRTVRLSAYRNGVARADFAELCQHPLGPADFLAIAAAVRTLMIDRVPVLSRTRYDAAKRFVTLIDTLYEARRRLIASAEARPDQLYVEGANAFEFARTASRLIEMQSQAWADPGPDP